jgi:ribokinase
MKNVIIVGSINYDIVASAERLPQTGETVHGYGVNTFIGGKGANQAVQLALLGLNPSMVGQLGTDAEGDTALSRLAEKGVDVSLIRRTPDSRTGCASIYVDTFGKNMLVHAPGANQTISDEMIEAAAGVIRHSALYITQNEINMDAMVHGLRIAHSAGVPTFLNPAPAVPLQEEVFLLLDYSAPNETESEAYTGIRRDNVPPDIWRRDNAKWFMDRGVKNVCITLGENGAYFADSHNQVHVPAFPITPVDTTAAGDSFIGGFAYGIVNSWPIEDSLVFANACGALAAMTMGAQNSIQPLSRVMAFLKERKIAFGSMKTK